MLLGVWFITSAMVICCMLCGVWGAGSFGNIGADGVGVGAGCMMLVCELCALGTFVTCS